jgi:homoserine dehydrogenase
METEGLSFEKALAEAQAAGYAEADPGLDVDGFDTAHKAAILASLAYGCAVPFAAVHTEGIRHLAETDIRYALDLGYRIKLLAVIKASRLSAAPRPQGGTAAAADVEVRVHPTLVPVDHMLASVSGVYNAVMVQGDLVGRTLYYGRGAGRDPTASTVIADIVDVARNLVTHSQRRVPPPARSSIHLAIRKMDDIETRHYLRLSLLDRPGVLARIMSALGENGISIASVLQKEVSAEQCVPVVIVTHQSTEKRMNAALAEIDAMDVVGSRTVRLRIED